MWIQNLRAQEAALAEAEEREDLEIAAESAGNHRVLHGPSVVFLSRTNVMVKNKHCHPKSISTLVMK